MTRRRNTQLDRQILQALEKKPVIHAELNRKAPCRWATLWDHITKLYEAKKVIFVKKTGTFQGKPLYEETLREKRCLIMLPEQYTKHLRVFQFRDDIERKAKAESYEETKKLRARLDLPKEIAKLQEENVNLKDKLERYKKDNEALRLRCQKLEKKDSIVKPGAAADVTNLKREIEELRAKLERATTSEGEKSS